MERKIREAVGFDEGRVGSAAGQSISQRSITEEGAVAPARRK